jgi:hypothetical protein
MMDEAAAELAAGTAELREAAPGSTGKEELKALDKPDGNLSTESDIMTGGTAVADPSGLPNSLPMSHVLLETPPKGNEHGAGDVQSSGEVVLGHGNDAASSAGELDVSPTIQQQQEMAALRVEVCFRLTSETAFCGHSLPSLLW